MELKRELSVVLRGATPEPLMTVGRSVRDLLARARYRGDAVHCPLCSSSFSGFTPFNNRPAARCPRCGSLERHRLMVLFLERSTDLFERSQRVLHIAPERQLRQRLSGVHGEGYLYGDVADPEHYVDVTEMPFEDASFDVVICSHVFEHVPDDRKAVSEVHRVLAPGGWAILDAPVDERREVTFEDPTVTTPRDRQRVFKQWDHVRIYGRDYPDLLRGGGFDVELDPLQVGPEDARRFGIREAVDRVYYCRRE